MTPAATSGRKRRAYAPRVPAAQRRTQLLDAALHLVVTRGHNAVTMDAVAEQAGVTKPVVYSVFVNRADLLAALLHREQRQGMAQLLSVLPADLDRLPVDPAELVEQALTRFLRVVRAAPDRWHCIVLPMADMPAPFHLAREEARADVLGRTTEVARSLLRSLDAPPELDPEIVAHAVVALFEMAARLVLTDPERFPVDRFRAAVRAAVDLAHPR
ncbi:DNA-binding transcriptional regulator, AcrR family [Amycolatopsis arida]|uniref:DNA-binding transcriptional regulator, AcrR family n=1 Tax=Amycolatopsis arida TaxID=587909 RepID=A0A1I5VQ77_9PSEU|nr:AcrR family transcriptional regulator [Amycolatopsis arida]SFQ09437.1 DNA-binding transcriptional regulator, AcrR family [Amycolatopsis arida]